jgi:hypothetical protein
MTRNVRSCVGLLLLSLWTIVSCSSADDSLSVGTARRDITPKEPLPLWGYSSYHDALSQGTLDPLYANALVVQLGGKKLAIVSLDLGRPPAEDLLNNIRKRIKSKTGIEYSFIAATHTHHGPVLELSDQTGKGRGRFNSALRYYSQLEDSIVDAVVKAADNLKPAKMAVGGIQLTNFNYNRHTQFQPAPQDTDLVVLRFDDLSGKPIAILVNFAAHPTLVPESLLKYSADYPGVVEKIVEKDTGADVLFMQGATGDLAANGKDYEKFGKDLAKEVVKLDSSLRTKEVIHPALQVKEERFTFKSRVNLNDPMVRNQLDKTFFPKLVANYVDEYAHGIRPRLTVAVLNGEIALVGVSGEFFCNHALRLKERARVKKLLFFGFCNGYDQYFPTIEATAEGGYGTDNINAPATVGAGEQMMNTALIWIYEMQQPQGATPGF